MKGKKDQLISTTKSLDEELLSLVDQNLILISKATAMKRKSEEKKNEIKSIDRALEVLAKKKKSLE